MMKRTTMYVLFGAICLSCVLWRGAAAGAVADVGVEISDKPVDEQTRIDTILQAYRRLPESELISMGIDPSVPIDAGSAQADLLFNTWNNRIAEIRQIMNSVAKPVTVMEDIILTLKNNTKFIDGSSPRVNEDETQDRIETILFALQNLESLVSDVDNAKDFHTIGGWPILSSLLGARYPSDVRAAAAWAIGTAIKNSYDYQLWTVEAFEDVLERLSEVSVDGNTIPITVYHNTSTLKYLLDIISDEIPYDYPLMSKAFYALTAALRGNPDVQLEIMQFDSTFLHRLKDIIRQSASMLDRSDACSSGECVNDVPVDALQFMLKLWHFLHDLAEERRYVHVELAHDSDLSASVREEMLSLKLLGDDLMSTDWIMFALDSFLALGAISADGVTINEDDTTVAANTFRESCKTFLAQSEEINSAENDDIDSAYEEVEVAVQDSAAVKNIKTTTTLRILQNSLGFVDSVFKQSSDVSVISRHLGEPEMKHSLIYYRHVLAEAGVNWCGKWANLDAERIRRDIHLINSAMQQLSEF